MFLIDAKDDGLRESIRFGYEVGEMRGDGPRPRTQSDLPFKIGRVVIDISNLPPVSVQLALRRVPPGGIVIRDDAVNLVKCQKTVGDALSEAVLV